MNVGWESVKDWLGVGLFPDSHWEEACPALFEHLQQDSSDPAPATSARPGSPGSAAHVAPALASMNWSKPKSSFSLWRFKLTAQCRLELAYLIASHVSGREGDGRQSEIQPDATTDPGAPAVGPKLQLRPHRAKPLSGWGDAVRQGDPVLCAVLLQLSGTKQNNGDKSFASLQNAMQFAAASGFLDVAQVLYGAGCSFYVCADKNDDAMPVSVIEARHSQTLYELGLPDEEALLEAAESNDVEHVRHLVKLGTSLCCADSKGRSPLTLAALCVTQVASHVCAFVLALCFCYN